MNRMVLAVTGTSGIFRSFGLCSTSMCCFCSSVACSYLHERSIARWSGMSSFSSTQKQHSYTVIFHVERRMIPRLGKPNSSGVAIQSLASKMIPAPQLLWGGRDSCDNEKRRAKMTLTKPFLDGACHVHVALEPRTVEDPTNACPNKT